MAGKIFDPNRLYATLLNTGLQTRDNALYQVIYQMIQTLAGLKANVTAISNNPSTNTIIIGTQGAQGFEGLDGEDAPVIIGPQGSAGPAGADGPMTPYFIASGETFTVPLYKQSLFAMNIDNEGTLEVDGFLIEVN